jgi:hypothetical protein
MASSGWPGRNRTRSHRSDGLSRRWLIDSELRSGIKEILLWVIVGNAHARSFYVSLGFRPTGRRQPVPGPENRTEELLAYVIDRLGFRPG